MRKQLDNSNNYDYLDKSVVTKRTIFDLETRILCEKLFYNVMLLT